MESLVLVVCFNHHGTVQVAAPKGVENDRNQDYLDAHHFDRPLIGARDSLKAILSNHVYCQRH